MIIVFIIFIVFVFCINLYSKNFEKRYIKEHEGKGTITRVNGMIACKPFIKPIPIRRK